MDLSSSQSPDLGCRGLLSKHRARNWDSANPQLSTVTWGKVVISCPGLASFLPVDLIDADANPTHFVTQRGPADAKNSSGVQLVTERVSENSHQKVSIGPAASLLVQVFRVFTDAVLGLTAGTAEPDEFSPA